MKKISPKDTKPEMRVRRYLHAHGLRYRLHVRQMPGTPDIVLRKYNAVVQVRGCFWHQHNCRHAGIPKTRRNYWVPKLKRTIERDKENDRKLKQLGWRLWVIWECEIRTHRLLESVGEKLVFEIVNAESC